MLGGFCETPGIRQAGTGKLSRLLLVLALSCCMRRVTSQEPVCSPNDLLCDVPGVIATPVNETVFRVNCGCVGDGIICPTISFHAVYPIQNVSRLVLESYAGVRANYSDSCTIPTTGVFSGFSTDSSCGLLEYTQLPEQITTPGYRVVRFAAIAAQFFEDYQTNYLCFYAVSIGGTPMPKRCVFFQVTTRPQSLFVTNSSLPAESVRSFYLSTINVVLGTELRLRVITFHKWTSEVINIDLRTMDCPAPIPGIQYSCPSPELPNQRWESDTTCRLTGPPATPCQALACERTLIYRPQPSEEGQMYGISFQALANGPPMVSPRVTPLGVACGGIEGLCAEGPYLDVYWKQDYQITVLQNKPTFVTHDPNKLVYTSRGVPTNPPIYSLEGTPANGVVLPKAFINCAIPGFGVYASKPGSQLTLSLEASPEGTPDARKLGLSLSAPYLVLEGEKGDNPPVGAGATDEFSTYVMYSVVSWTPPREALGQTFNICFKVADDVSSASRCVVLEVERCLYCTVERDTLESVAGRFRTSWLQVWTANYPGWFDFYEKDTGINPNVTPWVTTKNPDDIHPGLLLRLGPVYLARHDIPVHDLINRFQLSMETLTAANPDITANTTIVPAGAKVCVLADICTIDKK